MDEIDALPLVLQGKLLSAIEIKRVRRLGAVAERVVDVKFVAATNASLPEAISTGRFRVDLYHRLAVVVLTLPPLRVRGEDVLLLAEMYLRHYTVLHGVAPKYLNTAAQAWVQGYGWPGNIRELSHVMERVDLIAPGGGTRREEPDAALPYFASVRHVQGSRLVLPRSHVRGLSAGRSGADSAGALANGRQCDAGSPTTGGEPGYRALSSATLWHHPSPSRHPAGTRVAAFTSDRCTRIPFSPRGASS